MNLRRLSTVAALTLAAFAASVPAASAGSDESIITDGGGAWFYASHTEQIYVKDIRRDGYGVRAELRWKGADAAVSDTNGPGGGIEHQDLALREGTNVELRLCYTDNGRKVKCSGWQRAEA